MASLSPYETDPFYERLRAKARAKKASENAGPTKLTVGDVSLAGQSSDGPNIDVVGAQMSSALAPTTTINTPSAQIEINDLTPVVGDAAPRYGVTKDYSTLMRIADGVSANAMPLFAAGVTESTAPLVAAAKGEALKVGLGQTPKYLRESPVVGGLPTQVGGFQAGTSYLREPTGAIREVSWDEMGDYPEGAVLSAREAAERNPIGWVGPDRTTPMGQIADAGIKILSAVNPMAGILGMMTGEVLETPIGTPYATGSGLAGMLAKNNYKTMWETHERMNAGIPGNFGMKVGNSYVTYQATDGIFGTGLNGAKVVGRNMNAEQFQKMYASQMGYDYRTVDFNNSKAGELQGERLQGFSDGVGGFSAHTGEFVDTRGNTYTDLSRDQVNDYVSSLSYSPAQLESAISALENKRDKAANSVFGSEYKQNTYQMAISAIRGRAMNIQNQLAALSPEKYELAMQQLSNPQLSRMTPEQIQKLGLVINVTESSLSPGATKWRTVTDPVTGKVNRYNFNIEKDPEELTLAEKASGITDPSVRSYIGWDDGGDGDNDSPPPDSPGGSYGYDEFATGGRVKKATGMAAIDNPQSEQDSMGPVGFVNGRTPEEVTDADTVRDDVEGAVPEGTFVINAAAVERYGSERIRKLLMSALQEAERQGIDISSTDSTITDEESVSVAVSEGEVLVPPILVRIIGLQKLEKINALGEAEAEDRVEEYGQAEVSEPIEGEETVQASMGGGFINTQV